MKTKIFKIGAAISLYTMSMNVTAVEFGLFGDVNFYKNDAPGENSAFSVGALDFFATTDITDDTRVFIEYVFEDGGDGLVTDLERLWIGRTFNDSLMASVGRFHTPLGVWNRTYHHGALLQDTVTRPFFLDFEDGAAGILPVHIVGALANGEISVGNGELNYEAYVANGASIDSSAGFNPLPADKPEIGIGVASDANSSKTIGLRLTYTPDELPLTIGAMYMDNPIAEAGDGTGLLLRGEDLILQTILGFDINMETEKFILLSEFYSMQNDSRVGDNKSHTGTAYYVQLGYKFNEASRIIYRYANLDFDAADSYFLLLGATAATHNVLAFRHDLDVTNAIKFEINRNEPAAAGAQNDTTYIVQWAFMVP